MSAGTNGSGGLVPRELHDGQVDLIRSAVNSAVLAAAPRTVSAPVTTAAPAKPQVATVATAAEEGPPPEALAEAVTAVGHAADAMAHVAFAVAHGANALARSVHALATTLGRER